MSIASRAAKRAAAAATSSAAAVARRRATAPFSSTASRASGGGHGSQYDPPTGWLFGVKPGEKYKNEGWEKPFFWGFCGSLLVFACIVPFKPDTSYVLCRPCSSPSFSFWLFDFC